MGKLLKKLFRFRTIFTLLTAGALVSLVFSYLASYIHPESLSLLPFFGLAYWIIILVNLVLLVFWVIMKSKWSIAILFVLVLGGRLHFRTYAMGTDEDPSGKTELRVMSYNVHLFDRYNSDRNESYKTKSKILSYIESRNPDVVCFQEFYHQDPPTSFVTKDTILKLMNTKHYHERFAHKLAGRQNFGVAMFSKYRIIEKGNLNFESYKGNYNYCIYADIVKGIDTFRVYNVHLQSIKLQKDDYAIFDPANTNGGDQSSNVFKLVSKIRNAYPVRAKQAELIREHMSESPYNVIVCGDFNDTPVSYCYNRFGSSLTDAFRNTSKGIGVTYAGRIPAMRIDYIFHSKTLGSRNFTIQNAALSDHYAIDCSVFVKDLE